RFGPSRAVRRAPAARSPGPLFFWSADGGGLIIRLRLLPASVLRPGGHNRTPLLGAPAGDRVDGRIRSAACGRARRARGASTAYPRVRIPELIFPKNAARIS